MVSVLPPTLACTVRTVAPATWLAAGLLPGCELVAATAAMPPPITAAAARLTLAMMILGFRMVLLLEIGMMLHLLRQLVEGDSSFAAATDEARSVGLAVLGRTAR